MTNNVKSSNVDFHMSIEENPLGGALLLSQGQVRLGHTNFTIDLQVVTHHKVNETISFISDLQKMMVHEMKVWGEKHGATTTTKG